MAIEELDERGSLWHRWDPHIHAPGTARNDQFAGPNAMLDYIKAVETSVPVIRALGVTDYFSSATYQAVVEQKRAGRLPNVGFIFPNIELRLDTLTNKRSAVNIHLLVSPEDDNHVEEINNFLGQLVYKSTHGTFHCSRDQLVRLGKKDKPDLANDEEAAYKHGNNLFKVDFDQLTERLRSDPWMRRNSLIALDAGSGQGSSGVRTEDGAFADLRRKLEASAHIIFDSNPTTVAFWRGLRDKTPDSLEREYNGCKPCLHGSDAHKLEEVGAPADDRFCWIKGDLTFETLRQVCFEPETRVHIGRELIHERGHVPAIATVSTTDAPWLLDHGLQLNQGLVAIIGSRGSGKTALADVIAAAAGCEQLFDNRNSFVSRASKYLDDVEASIQWVDDETSTRPIGYPLGDVDVSKVHYLSQQFVERLCSSEGIDDRLIDEVQKVVFQAQPVHERLGASSFTALLSERCGDAQTRRVYYGSRLDEIADEVYEERSKRQAAKALPKQREIALINLNRLSAERLSIVRTKGDDHEARASYYQRLRKAIEDRELAIQGLKKREAAVEKLRRETTRYQVTVFPDLKKTLRESCKEAGLEAAEWTAFEIAFVGDVATTLAAAAQRAAADVHACRTGNLATRPQIGSSEEEVAGMHLDRLKEACDEVAKTLGIDERNAKRLAKLNNDIATTQAQITDYDRRIQEGKDSVAREQELFKERSAAYTRFFEALTDEEAQLRDLYKPLERALEESLNDSISRLRLSVMRSVDVESWANAGEELLDLRKNGEFRGHGALQEKVNAHLSSAWGSGSAEEVAEAMQRFREQFDDEFRKQAKIDDPSETRKWTIEMGRWLHSTEHIEVTYDFTYDGMPLSQLSPGTRGIVLLLLYLALDQEDERPLIIDQPEENLDPRSVMSELVPLFRDARGRRQVIIVTHNANLVVNTDVDQVIVANCDRTQDSQPPTFTYSSGSIENYAIRSEVCKVLEGGEPAFRERAKRLRINLPTADSVA